ncbi:MAG: 50S ribosomal protein L6 [Alphaproteobacteria bacterium]
MSRVGKLPVSIPSGVNVNIAGQDVEVKGQKGLLRVTLASEITAAREGDTIVVTPRDESKRAHQMWGLSRSIINNMITGVSEGFTVNLEIIGVGYRASVAGKTLTLELGYSHSISHPIPDGIEIKCERPTMVAVSGADRQAVGQVAAEIRAYRSPEPYKGKGIRYVGEYVRRKEGKKK